MSVNLFLINLSDQFVEIAYMIVQHSPSQAFYLKLSQAISSYLAASLADRQTLRQRCRVAILATKTLRCYSVTFV